MSKKELTKRYALFLLSVLINGFGIAVITFAHVGTTPISSSNYVLSLHSDDLEIANFRDQNTAFADYTAKEAQHGNANHVLASTNNHDDLNWLYPNYYRDLRPFAKLVREILEKD